jgi:membrane protease YdiL (CAAX protease family)
VIPAKPFPGPLAALGLTAAVLMLVVVLDPRGEWPLGAVNVAAFGAVIAAGVGWSRARPVPETAPVANSVPKVPWNWGLVAGVVLSAWGGGIVVGQLGNLVLAIWPMPASFVATLNRLFDLSQPLKVLVPLMLIAPLTEEGLFRGVMLPALVRRHSAVVAIAWTSLLFALVHLNPWQGAGALVAGVYLGALRVRTGSLLAPMVAHGLFNGFPILLALGGVVIVGYNTPETGTANFLPWWWLTAGATSLGLGLALSLGWRPGKLLISLGP